MANRTSPGVSVRALLAVGCAALWLSCTAEMPPEVFDVIDRASGDRAPRAASCDDIDPARCLLPWPSNTFTRVDTGTATGLRLDVDLASLNNRDDSASLALADGFSRVSSLLAHFEAPLAEDSLAGGVHLFLVQADHRDRLTEVPLRVETVTNEDNEETLLIADPRTILAPDADYLVVVTDDLRRQDGVVIEPTRGTLVALEMAEPMSEEEALIAGYHAPNRALLRELSLDPARVLRMWDFTTRSAANGRSPLVHMRAAAIEALSSATVTITSVETPDDPAIAMVAHGQLEGLPTFLDEGNRYVPSADGQPVIQGTSFAPFRVVVPAGTGDYRFAMYGHGTGGNQLDDAFDTELAEIGLAKVNVRFYGWTDSDVLSTFAGLRLMSDGSFAAASQLLEALAHTAAVQRAVHTIIGDALSAEMIADVPNPAAGRRPSADDPMWVGGSLGGTMGLIYASSEPSIRYAVINVPGAAWAQWVWQSVTFDLIHELLLLTYDDDVDLATALAIAQTNLDLADGISWVDLLEENPTIFLVQESMGDPVLPNPGTEMVAIATGARHVGGILEPIDGVEPAAEVIEGSGITQFQAPRDGDKFDIHGFAARGSMAGAAAREQILDFVSTGLFEGNSRIAPPASCPASGCDFGL